MYEITKFVTLLLFVSLCIVETSNAQMSAQQFAWLEAVLRSSAVNRSVNLAPPDDQFLGSPLPNLAGVVRSLRGSSRSESVNAAVDKLLAEIPPLQQSGQQKGEVRRRLLHAFTLLSTKAWTPEAEYGASLELRGAPSVIDLSKPLTAQLTQAFSAQPPSSSALQMRLLVREFAFEESGRVIENSRILKVIGPFNGVSNDLIERPFPVSANLTGVPEGIYRLVVEVLDGNVSIGKQMRTVWFVRDLEARRADIEKKLPAYRVMTARKRQSAIPSTWRRGSTLVNSNASFLIFQLRCNDQSS